MDTGSASAAGTGASPFPVERTDPVPGERIDVPLALGVVTVELVGRGGGGLEAITTGVRRSECATATSGVATLFSFSAGRATPASDEIIRCTAIPPCVNGDEGGGPGDGSATLWPTGETDAAAVRWLDTLEPLVRSFGSSACPVGLGGSAPPRRLPEETRTGGGEPVD